MVSFVDKGALVDDNGLETRRELEACLIEHALVYWKLTARWFRRRPHRRRDESSQWPLHQLLEVSMAQQQGKQWLSQ
jgi:hypothetical protein